MKILYCGSTYAENSLEKLNSRSELAKGKISNFIDQYR